MPPSADELVFGEWRLRECHRSGRWFCIKLRQGDTGQKTKSHHARDPLQRKTRWSEGTTGADREANFASSRTGELSLSTGCLENKLSRRLTSALITTVIMSLVGAFLYPTYTRVQPLLHSRIVSTRHQMTEITSDACS